MVAFPEVSEGAGGTIRTGADVVVGALSVVVVLGAVLVVVGATVVGVTGMVASGIGGGTIMGGSGGTGPAMRGTGSADAASTVWPPTTRF